MSKRHYTPFGLPQFTGNTSLSPPALGLGLTIPGINVFQSAPNTGIQFDSGTVTVAVGQTGDIVIPIGFATSATPAVVKFYCQADVFIDSSNGTAKGVGFGAYDGTRQFSHVHAASFPTGFRLGGLFLDAIHDAGNNGGLMGARIVGKSLAANTCTLHIDRSLPAGSTLTILWQAIAGCNARVGNFEIPPGTYGAIGPLGVSITGLPFTPKGFEFHSSKSIYYNSINPKHALTAADEGFVTAWHAQCIGFASNSGGTIRQGSIGGVVNHDGWHFNMAYRGCIAGPPRTDYNFLWPMGYVTSFNSDGVTLNFDSADNGGDAGGGYIIYGQPYIAYDCECYAGITQLNTGAGAVAGLTGAPFNPTATLFGAAPNIDQIWPIGAYPDPSILSIVGSENSSIGFAINANGTLKQGGIAKYDQSSYSTIAQQRILNADIDVNGTGTSTAHDATGLLFTDAIVKGQQRTSQQNFAINGVAAATGFVTGGIAVTQSSGSGKAGYMAFMHMGASGPDLGLNANLNGKAIFAAGTEWQRNISALPVDPNSATLISTNAGAFKLEGLGYQSGGSFAGIPYIVVDSRTQPMVDVVVGDYSSESTVCRAPIPPRYDIIESYPHTVVFPALPDGSDSHCIVVDRYLWVVYELNGTYRRGSDWYCRSMTVFDLDLGDDQLPYGWTSGDVGGLSIFQGLLRGEEFTKDTINHAIRTTVNLNQGWFTKPAMHAAYNGTNTAFIPLGARMRLRASYPETGNFPSTSTPITATHAKIIRAMKKYGIMNADANGAGPTLWSQGDTSPLFSDYAANLIQLQLIQGSDFDVVQSPNPQYFYGDAFTYPTGAVPTVALTASSNSIVIGGTSTLTPTVTNAVRQSLAPLPGVLKPVAPYTASPVRDTWYTLQGVNKFGAAYAFQRVLVSNWTHRETVYDFYVSPTGSMTNAGTLASPFSLDLFNGSYNPLIAGMTIGFLDGTYTVSGTARASDTTVNALYHIAGGAPGKPTILQAVNRRGAVIALGSRTDPVFGSYYDGMSTGHVWYIGLEFTGTGALHAISHITGSGEGVGYLIDDCKFAANFTYPVRLSTGPFSGAPYQHGNIKPYIRACEFPGAAGKALVLLGGTDDALIASTVLAGGAAAMSEGLGLNSGTVVIP